MSTTKSWTKQSTLLSKEEMSNKSRRNIACWNSSLKLHYFGHLMRRTDSSEKTLMLGKIEGRRRRGDRGQDGWVASPTRWTWVWASLRRWAGKPGMLQCMGSQRVGYDWATELNWTELKMYLDWPTYFCFLLNILFHVIFPHTPTPKKLSYPYFSKVFHIKV